MSLYHDSATFLASSADEGPLKARVYAPESSQSPQLKSKPAQIYALISEATKWSAILSDIIDASGLLTLERKLDPALALLLTHDLLVAKSGVAAPREHPLRLAIERHRARLSAEFTKRRVRAGFATLREWYEAIAMQNDAYTSLSSTARLSPRWIRINTLKTTLNVELSTTFAGYSRVPTLQGVMSAAPEAKLLAIDTHVPDLVAVPRDASIPLIKSAAYAAGHIIFQDKASCFPALLLDPQPEDGDVVDACAAPGNKTTHLASLMIREAMMHTEGKRKRTLYACERDSARATTLSKMTRLAGTQDASAHGLDVRCLPGQDFLRLDPRDPRFRDVGAILLDPSCSGSGIIGREDGGEHDGEAAAGAERFKLVLPRAAVSGPGQQAHSATRKKRKRGGNASVEAPSGAAAADGQQQATPTPTPTRRSLAERLAALARFQETLLGHAFCFPAARKVAYSTCSMHAAENEHVALAALAAASGAGWRVARREEQVAGMRDWSVRGDAGAVAEFIAAGKGEEGGDVEEFAEACLRCEKGTEQGTMGFFAVLFVRDDGVVEGGEAHGQAEEDDEEEWEGFSNAE